MCRATKNVSLAYPPTDMFAKATPFLRSVCGYFRRKITKNGQYQLDTDRNN